MSYAMTGFGEGVEAAGSPAEFDCQARGGTWMGTYCLGGGAAVAASPTPGLKAQACANSGGVWNSTINFCACKPPAIWTGSTCQDVTAAALAAAAAACAQAGKVWNAGTKVCSAAPKPIPYVPPGAPAPVPAPLEPVLIEEPPFYRKPIGMALIAGAAILAVAAVASRGKRATPNARTRRALTSKETSRELARHKKAARQATQQVAHAIERGVSKRKIYSALQAAGYSKLQAFLIYTEAQRLTGWKKA